MADKHYVGEVGTDVVVDCAEDISLASVHDLYVKKPDGTKHTWAGSIYNTNYIRHTTVTGDFDQAGIYELQAAVTMPAWIGHGEKAAFSILEVLG